MVIQMAKAVGARVIATAGGPEKADVCRRQRRPCHRYRSQQRPDRDRAGASESTCSEKTPRSDFDLAVSCLAENGRTVLMAGRTARPEFPVGPFYVKGCTLVGFAMFKAAPELQRVCAQDINHWLSTGMVKPLIDRVLPLSQTAEAHRLQEAHTVAKQSLLTGKLVLQPDG